MLTTIKAYKDIMMKKDVKTKKLSEEISSRVESRKKE